MRCLHMSDLRNEYESLRYERDSSPPSIQLALDSVIVGLEGLLMQMDDVDLEYVGEEAE